MLCSCFDQPLFSFFTPTPFTPIGDVNGRGRISHWSDFEEENLQLHYFILTCNQQLARHTRRSRNMLKYPRTLNLDVDDAIRHPLPPSRRVYRFFLRREDALLEAS